MGYVLSFTWLSGPFAEALGWTILHALWQGGIVALFLFTCLGISRNQSPQFRYLLGIGAQVLVLVVAVVTFIMVYRPDAPLSAWEYNSFQNLPLGGDEVVLAQGEQKWGRQQLLMEIFAFFDRNVHWVACLWICGVSVFTFRLFGGMVVARALARKMVTPVSGEWALRLGELARGLNVKPPQLLESARIYAPVVIGYIRPVILLPIGLLAGLPAAQVEALLIHELAHIRRRDYLVNLLLSVLETLFFFHPAIWWMGTVVRRERELCCDDTTIRYSGDSIAYAKALSALPQWQPVSSLAMAANGRPKELLFRIRRILLPQPSNQHDVMEKIIAVFLIIGSFFLLSLQAKPSFVGASAPDRTSVSIDSLPRGRVVIKQKKDGKSIEAELRDGAIVSLNVDGNKVEEKDFNKYEREIMELMEKLPPSPPVPPAPPRPGMPPLPGGEYEEENREIVIEQDGGDTLLMDKRFSLRFFPGVGRSFDIGLEPVDPAEIAEMARDMAEMARKFAEEKGMRMEMERGFGDSLHIRLEGMREGMERLKDLRMEIELDGLNDLFQNDEERSLPRYWADEELGIYPVPRRGKVSAAQQIERALLRDELIEKKGKYKFELSDRSLKINGEKMPDALRRKYIRIYEEATGIPWDAQNKFVIHSEVKGG
ncbi:MAG: M56 family metallopeptidase [Saprospiraceae bacterium]